MVQPYPSASQLPQLPQRPPVPASVRRAVMAMYIGALTALIQAAIFILTASSTKAAISRAHLTTAHDLVAYADSVVMDGVIVGVIECGLFIWIAVMCRNGKNWARITGTVFFGIGALGAILGINVPDAPLDRIWVFVTVLPGLVAVFLLWWLGTSNDYFNAASRRSSRQSPAASPSD